MGRSARTSVAWLLVAVAVAACGRDGRSLTSAPPTRSATPAASIIPDAMPSERAEPTATATRRPELEPTALASLIEPVAIERHLIALQAIADETGGHRASGSPGFDASLDYAAGELQSFGFDVRRQPWELDGRAGTNLLVEREGSTDRVVMLGAHLDSVRASPGINDDGSGVAAALAIAEALTRLPPPDATIRLALWDAEEGGPFGSAAYVAGLGNEERDRIGAYLNLDMIGSPNAVRFVYAETDAAAGSEAITAAFAAHFEDLGLPWEPIDLEGDSDHGPFIAAGIPTGGLFSGGIEPVTEAQAVTFGAEAGVPADACSHAACDTIENVDLETLTGLARAAASVLAGLASPD